MELKARFVIILLISFLVLCSITTADLASAEILSGMNKYRAEVGSPPLVYSNTVASSSQDWANYLAKNALFQHSNSNYGENIFMGTSGPITWTEVINAWGSEKKNFIYAPFGDGSSTTGYWGDVGHYTQIIWYNTQQCGCGKATGYYPSYSSNMDVYVCEFNPPGNYDDQYPYPKPLPITTGLISIQSTPPDAKIYLDGADTGFVTPKTISNLATGSHTIKCSLSGYNDGSQSVTVLAGQTASIQLVLQKTEVLPPGTDYKYVRTLGTSGSGNGQFKLPYGVAVDEARNRVYVADTWNHRIQAFDRNGNFITKWGTRGPLSGQFDYPFGIAVDKETGYVYTAEQLGNRVQVFSQDGTFIRKWGSSGTNNGQFDWSDCIAVDGGRDRVYVTDTRNNRVEIFDRNGNFISKFGSFGSGNGQIKTPYGIAVNPINGYIYVCDPGNSRIQIFDFNGNYLNQFGTRGAGVSQFLDPLGVEVDDNGRVFVAETVNGRIQVFSDSGAYITQWGTFGTGIGQLNMPYDVAVDDIDGYIYVADTENSRVQVFAPTTIPVSPASITSLINTTYQPSYITWTWTDPTSTDFSKVMVYIDGVFKTNVTKGVRTYTASSLTPGTQHTISTHTVGTTGLVNPAWVSSTKWSASIPPTVPVASFIGTPTSGAPPLTVQFTDTTTNTPTGWAWYFGDESYTAPWMQMAAAAGWSAREGFSSVAMSDGSIVLMGGYNSGGHKNDVWRSTNNGATWTQMTASAEWSARGAQRSVAMPDGSIILMGGVDNTYTNKNDVWRSTNNGATWTQMTASAGWSGRYFFSSVAMPDGSIVLMGGNDGTNKNDVWRSTNNGATWTQMTASAGWSARPGSSSVVMPDGSIVLMGGNDGGYNNDVWRSTNNGATWTQVTASAGWTARDGHSSVAMPDGSIVLMGGQDKTYSNKNDVWRSTNNGATWTQMTASAGWTGRTVHSSVAMPDGSIVLMGGSGGGYKNDVWRFTPVGSSVQNPSHSYTTPGIYPVTLQAFKTSGYSSTRKIGYITVTSSVVAPVANFIINKTSGFSPLSVQFTDTSTGSMPLTYQWDFGDLTYSALQSPVHTYTAMDNTAYIATLTTSNSAGSSSKFLVISVNVTPLVIPPASITGLDNTTFQQTSITWTWTDPSSTDFSKVMVYLDGVFQINVTKGIQTYTALSLNPGTEHTIAIHTVGTIGLVNQTWVSDTARTAPVTPSTGSIFIQSYPTGARIYLDYGDTGVMTPATLPSLAAGSHVIRCSLSGYDDTTQTVSVVSGQRSDVMLILQKSGNVAPKADFSASAREGGSPLPVQFTDKSTNSPTSWAWTFGDGSTSTEQNPAHTYVKSGMYSVKLKVSNPAGSNGLSRSGYIVVSSGPLPTPTPTASPTPTPTPTVTPTTTPTPIPTLKPTPTPTPTPDPGVLKAGFTADSNTGTIPLVVSFQDLSMGIPTSWSWTFGDGSTSNEQNPTHTYLKAGMYSVKLKVSNSAGSSGLSRSGFITVSNG